MRLCNVLQTALAVAIASVCSLSVAQTDAVVRESGSDPSGRARFATWDEDGVRWFATSRDAGQTWSESRRLERHLALLDGEVLPETPMPEAPAGFTLPADGRLYIVQFRTVGLPEWREALANIGVEVLSHVPHNAHIVRIDEARPSEIRALEFVERVEPFHPWYRLAPELRQETGGLERIRLLTFEWGEAGKARVIEEAEALGARVADYWPSGHIVELWANPEQIRALAAHDEVAWIERWTPYGTDMDLVREDAGSNWVENRFGYCGQQVRGEVMDAGIQADHPDFDGILLHGPHNVDSHGTATYGIVFGNGDRDGDGDAKGTGHLACEQAQGIFAGYPGVGDRFVHTQELKGAPYLASFQTNSWGAAQTTSYTTKSQDMDDIIWRLDIAITQSQSNTGGRSSRPEAWAKNVISVGGIRHYDTLDTSDDAWAGGASIGPAADGRIKPDVNYWFDDIYTTTTGSGYRTDFGGTSGATPETAGVLGLILQMWADNVWETDPVGATVFEKQPHFSTLKALLVNSARQYDFAGTAHDLTRVHQGWGRPSARTAYERASRSLVVDEEEILQINDAVVYDVAVAAGESELKVTMVYPDPPGTTTTTLHRINDVNLKVTSPSATVYHGNVGLDEGTESVAGGDPNGVDTVENVFVRDPESGIWQVEIEAVEVNQDAWLDTPEDDVTFALVVSGATAPYTSGVGQVRIMQAEAACGDVFPLRVRDGNVGSTTVTVDVWSDSDPTPEGVLLVETTPGSGTYTGETPITLTTSHGDGVTVEYLDADDGAGGTDVPRQDSAAVDCQGPLISQVSHTDVSDVAATIGWTTDEGSDSSVIWDSLTPPGRTDVRAGNGTSHTVRLSGLTECTAYYYSVGSEDPLGNASVDDNDGEYYHFVTLKRTDGELHSCRSGKLVIEADAVSCTGNVLFRLSDLDLNQDPGVVEQAAIRVTSSTETTPEVLILTESGPNTAEFTGTISTGTGPAVSGDGILQTSDGDLVTGRHEDDDDGTGSGGTSIATVEADCSGAVVAPVLVSGITSESATIFWGTSELTTGHVDWGPTPAFGNQVSSNTLASQHSVNIGVLPECDRVYFRVVTADALGNESVADAGGVPFEFNAGTVPGIVHEDGFESDSGWSLPGEWEIGAPLGLGSAPGDPSSAYIGTGVLGHDLSGQGSYPGDYEPSVTESATSPTIDASTLANAELTFQRRLNVENGAIARLQVKDGGGGWNEIWASPSFGGFSESAWSPQSYDVSAYADGNSDFQIRFVQNVYIETSNDAGWNVDELSLRDGSLPPYDVCGGCGGSPSFNGVVSATDDDPCADSGVTLAWSPASAWGSGNSGSYAVYRATSPAFTPGPGNLLAGGVSGGSWTDTSAPADQTLYYIVRAENDESCSDGPANGGVTDDNLAYAVARNDTSQPWPGDTGATLTVGHVNRAHVRLSWSTTPDAAVYRVYRGASSDAAFDLVEESEAVLYEDPNAFADGQSWYYTVRATDACGIEGP